MSPDEIAARRPVWIALADLFLDTDVRLSYAHIADVLGGTVFSPAELKRILDREVTPALQGNLLTVAGEWASFDDDWVVEQVLAGSILPRLVNLKHHWVVIERLIAMVPPNMEGDARKRKVDALRSLLWLFTSKNAPLYPGVTFPLSELEQCFRGELWPLLIENCRRLAAEHPVSYPSEAEIESNWRRYVNAYESAQSQSAPPSPE